MKKRGPKEKAKEDKIKQFWFYATPKQVADFGGIVAVQARIKELLNK